jgi:hypothetical protein
MDYIRKFGNYLSSSQSSIQLDKYYECLMYVNNDLGMLLQNAENLAYKLGAIEIEDLQYLNYDYYNQFEKKDEVILRKNIISSMKFLEAQFIAIKQETGKDYIFPPSIDRIKKDVQNWKKKLEDKDKNSKDIILFDKIYSILNEKKFKKIKDKEEIYKTCLERNRTNITPYMWMLYSPPILNNIDQNIETQKNNENKEKSMPDIIRGKTQICKKDLINSNIYNKDINEINAMLRKLKENGEIGKELLEESLKLKLEDFENKYKIKPIIFEENKKIYEKVLLDFYN